MFKAITSFVSCSVAFAFLSILLMVMFVFGVATIMWFISFAIVAPWLAIPTLFLFLYFAGKK